MIFPRECAIAEIAWSSKSSRDWDDFLRRLKIQAQRFDELNINYRHAAIETPEPNLLKVKIVIVLKTYCDANLRAIFEAYFTQLFGGMFFPKNLPDIF